MMKRILSLVLTLCLLATAAIALAEPTTEGVVTYPDGTGNFDTAYGTDITVIRDDAENLGVIDVYSVEIVWGDMQFAWGLSEDSGATNKKWDPETHTYLPVDADGNVIEGVEEGWYMVNNVDTVKPSNEAYDLGGMNNNAVMVFNHSSLAVKAAIACNNAEDVDTINAAGIDASFTATSANANGVDNVYTLKAATYGDIYADDGSSVMGEISLTEDPADLSQIPTTKAVVAKLNVTISKE